MNTNKQAPQCCPFCGAKGGGLYEGVARQYECGSWDWPKVPENGHPRESQSTKCAAAERERLTRERDEAKRKRDDQTKEIYAYVQSIHELKAEREQLLARVKQLESDWSGWPDLQREWFGGKYAAMQPLEAVRARIKDSEALIKGIDI